MNFFERMNNFFTHLIVSFFFPGIRDPFDEIFKHKFGDETIGVEVSVTNESTLTHYLSSGIAEEIFFLLYQFRTSH